MILDWFEDDVAWILGFLIALVIALCFLAGGLLLVALDWVTWRGLISTTGWIFMGVVLAGIFVRGWQAIRGST